MSWPSVAQQLDVADHEPDCTLDRASEGSWAFNPTRYRCVCGWVKQWADEPTKTSEP